MDGRQPNFRSGALQPHLDQLMRAEDDALDELEGTD